MKKWSYRSQEKCLRKELKYIRTWVFNFLVSVKRKHFHSASDWDVKYHWDYACWTPTHNWVIPSIREKDQESNCRKRQLERRHIPFNLWNWMNLKWKNRVGQSCKKAV